MSAATSRPAAEREVDALPDRRTDALEAPRAQVLGHERGEVLAGAQEEADEAHTAKRPVTAPATASGEYQVRNSRSTKVWTVKRIWPRISG